MSVWSRIANVLRRDRVSSEIDEELQSHTQEAIEIGRDPHESATSVRTDAAAQGIEPGCEADGLAGFAARRFCIRLTATGEEPRHFCGSRAMPAQKIAVAALLAAVPAVIRATRIDAVAMLRAE